MKNTFFTRLSKETLAYERLFDIFDTRGKMCSSWTTRDTFCYAGHLKIELGVDNCKKFLPIFYDMIDFDWVCT